MAVLLSRSKARSRVRNSVLTVLSFLLLTTQVHAYERLMVSFSTELSPHWFAGKDDAKWLIPAGGEIVAFGELSMGNDSVGDPSRLRMRFPDGSLHALRIERRSIVHELGRLVVCRFAIGIPAALIGEDGFALEYGDDVESPNVLMGDLLAAPSQRVSYREMSLVADADREARELSMKVIADRSAGHRRWLYLLPIALVTLAALSRRMLCCRS